MKTKDRQFVIIIIEYLVVFLTVFLVAMQYAFPMESFSESLSETSTGNEFSFFNILFKTCFYLAFCLCTLSFTVIMQKSLMRLIKRDKVISIFSMLLHCFVYIGLMLIYNIPIKGLRIAFFALTIYKIAFFVYAFMYLKKEGAKKDDKNMQPN